MRKQKSNKENIIEFYPFSKETLIFTPEPMPASRFVPDWYRKQPSTVEEKEGLANGAFNGTVKKCMPIFDIMTAGYMLTFPMDVYVDARDPEKLSYSVPAPMRQYGNDMFSTHAPQQYDHYPNDTAVYHKQLFRLMPFFSIKTPEGYSTLVIQPQHSDEVPFKTVSGFIDTDKFISDGHFSMFIRSGFNGVIKQGTPFAQIIPIQRESWSMNIIDPEIASDVIKKQRLNVRSTFKNGYKEKYRQKKEFK